MSNTFVHRAGIVCVLFVVGAVLMVLVTRVAASPSGVLDACVNPGNGMMRLVSDSSACHNNETFIEWNIQGPQGPQGPQGLRDRKALQAHRQADRHLSGSARQGITTS